MHIGRLPRRRDRGAAAAPAEAPAAADLLEGLQRARLRFVDALDRMKAEPGAPHRHRIARAVALYAALQQANAEAEACLARPRPAEAPP